MEILFTPNALIALLTLTFLEIILGIDNIVFLSIISGKLKEQDQPRVRRIGLFLAMAFRIILLFGITWVLGLQDTLLKLDINFFTAKITGQSLIILGGGIFLLYKSVTEIHHKMEGVEESKNGKATDSIASAILQIALLNIVFSFDSILTAIGMISMKEPIEGGFGYNGALVIMILSVVISIIIMMIFAGKVSKFVNEHPTIQILGLSFLILIGVMLIGEGAHLAHFKFGNDVAVGTIPKGYLYFAIFFSLFVEFLNLRMTKKRNPVKLRNNKIIEKVKTNEEVVEQTK